MAWDAGIRPVWRWTLFLIGQTVVVVLGLIGVWLNDLSIFAFLGPWLCFTAILAFILGTYDRLELTRNERGRVKLTKTWRICFVRRPPIVIPLREYAGVTTGVAADEGCLEWFIFAFLFLFCAIFPGILWWYFVIHKVTYFVALTKVKDFPELMLYRGWSDEHTRSIAETLRATAELPYEGN